MEPQRYEPWSGRARRGATRRRVLRLLGVGGIAAAFSAWWNRDRLPDELDLDRVAELRERDPTNTPVRTAATRTPNAARPRRTPTKPPAQVPDDGDDPIPPPTCPQGFTPCGDACVDLQSDVLNCGGCGQACGTDPAGLCEAGDCIYPVEACSPRSEVCDGRCTDVFTDPAHCGGCGRVCADDGSEECAAGICRVPCEKRTDGFKGECSGVCVDFQSDPEHCGGCDIPCRGDDFCRGGRCTSPPTPTPEEGPPLLLVEDVSFHRPVAGITYCDMTVRVRNDGTGPARGVTVRATRVEELVEGDPNKLDISSSLDGPDSIGAGTRGDYYLRLATVREGYPIVYSVEVSIAGTFVAGSSSPMGTGEFCDA